MNTHQFANSLSIIRRTEHTSRARALVRHLYWQARKLMFPFPVRLKLSDSVIMDDEPGGVIGLVNMLGRYDYNNMNFVQLVMVEAAAGRMGAFIDVGANIGAYTLIASEEPEAIVVSLEPVPAAFAKLQQNIRANGRDNVTALNIGASTEPGHLRMTCDGSSVFNHVVRDSGAASAVVQVDTLDAICKRLGILPALIKVDVEGHEPEVLAGAARVLRCCLACLVENGDRPEIVAFMRERGLSGPYHYRHRSGRLEWTPQPVPEDQIFVSPAFLTRFPSIVAEAPAAGGHR